MNYEEAVAYMSGRLRLGIKLGNARIEEICARLKYPERQYKTIHVAGTKGKGSTTALTAAILQAHGFNVGGYFSPYVYDLRERIQINGKPIEPEFFASVVTTLCPHIAEVETSPLGAVTEFELKTLAAFLAFAEAKMDWAAIEVGIGGRLDATNVVQPTACVITNIGLDHTEMLGNTYAAIAGEKAGIIKSGIPCITATEEPSALEVIIRTAAERDAPLIRVEQGDSEHPTAQPNLVRWEPVSLAADSALSEIHFAPFRVALEKEVLGPFEMRMGGIYQRVNATCAIVAVAKAFEKEGMALNPDAIAKGLLTAALPGRLAMVQLEKGPLVVMDGAHNGMAAQALCGSVEALKQRNGLKKGILVIGMVGGHEPDEVLSGLVSLYNKVYACRPKWRKAQPVETIADAARKLIEEVEVIEDVQNALAAALSEADEDTLVLLTGSFYTVGEVPPQRIEEIWQSLPSPN